MRFRVRGDTGLMSLPVCVYVCVGWVLGVEVWELCWMCVLYMCWRGDNALLVSYGNGVGRVIDR